LKWDKLSSGKTVYTVMLLSKCKLHYFLWEQLKKDVRINFTKIHVSLQIWYSWTHSYISQGKRSRTFGRCKHL